MARVSIRPWRYYGNKRQWTVILAIDNQSFILDPLNETKAEAEWTARMLRKALNKLRTKK